MWYTLGKDMLIFMQVLQIKGEEILINQI
jgi:hypothetical protein